ncbi:hypothetical protein ACQPXM_17705 [Kribbella sp. CA-253562]|uniref:hypothetical protein n=1 Tax=Kribbella sp. CA-253562 TaxID=3239942 RepID=UPI003D89F21C
MPVSITSRYRGLDVYDAVDAAGTVRPTVAIRRSAARPRAAVDYQHRVAALEDVEYLAWHYFGDSESWWRIADANPAVFPLRLRPGEIRAIPISGSPGLIERKRVF